MSLPIQYTTLLVPAGTVQNPGFIKSNLAGSGFMLDAATSQLQIQFDGGSIFPARAGFLLDYSSLLNTVGAQFGSVGFYNSSANPISVSFYVFQAGVTYVGSNQSKELSSRSVGGGIIALGAGLISAAIVGSNLGNQRKQIVIHNLDPNLQLYILDAWGVTVFDVIYPGQPWTMPTDSTFYVQNPNGGPVNYVVGQTFYNG